MLRRILFTLALLTLAPPALAGWTGWRSVRRLPPVAGAVLQFEGDLGGITLNGSAVSNWKDWKSGFSVAQATGGKQPGFTAADSAFSGRPSLSGSVASATQLTNTTNTPFTAGATRTVFFVFQRTDATTGIGAIYDSRHAATARPIWEWSGDNAGSVFTYTDAVAINQVITTPAAVNAKHVLSEIWTAGTTTQVWLDGVSQSVLGGVTTLDVEAAGFDLFARQNASTTYEGKIAAILAFSGALSTGNRQLVELYLNQKYGF